MVKIVYARTNAEFLNKEYGTCYKAWMKSRWEYDRNTWVWMVRFDGQIRQDWRNRRVNDSEIWEEYVGNEPPTYKDCFEKKYRIVVEVKDMGAGRAYCVLGKFMYDPANSRSGKNVFVRV